MEFWFDFIAGWTGGCAGIIVGHPLDTLKVRMQTRNFSKLWECLRHTYKHEHIRGFYNGMGFPLMTAGVLNCLFFGIYGNTLRFLNSPSDNPTVPSLLNVTIAAGVSAIPQLAIAVPVEVVKVQLQADAKGQRYQSPIDCFKDIYKNHGVKGCYRGFVTQMYRDSPSFVAYMLVFEGGLRFANSEGTTSSVQDIILYGGLAGVVSWMMILPLDVVKNRIQADDFANPRYRGMIHCFVESYRQDGIKIFGRGWVPVACRAFVTNAVTFLGYKWSLAACKELYEIKD